MGMTAFVHYPSAEISENVSLHSGIAKEAILGSTLNVYRESLWNTTITFTASASSADMPWGFPLPIKEEEGARGVRWFRVQPLAWCASNTGTLNAYLLPTGIANIIVSTLTMPYSSGYDPVATWALATTASGGNYLTALSIAAPIGTPRPDVLLQFDSAGLVASPFQYLWFELLPTSGRNYFAGFYIEEDEPC